jgi:hypothetical protein
MNEMKPVDSFAAEMIPIRLFISIAIVAVIVSISLFGLRVLRTSQAQHQVEQQCQDLVSSLETMVRSGAARDLDEGAAPSGTTRVQTLILPETLVYLCFGGDPDVENTGVLHPQICGDGGVIVYRVEGGSKQILWLQEGMYGFREGYLSNSTWTIEGNGESCIITQGGTSILFFELVKTHYGEYILIHSYNGIE